MQEQNYCVCAPDECDTFQFMDKKLGMKVLHPGGLQATKLLAERCNIAREMTILDAGCGKGSTSIFLAKQYGCRVVGVDIDPTSLIEAQKKARQQKVLDKVAFRLADLNSLPLMGNMFDGAIFQASLIFCYKTNALNSISSKIQQGGFLGAVELTWKAEPTPYVMSRVKSVLCGAAVNAEHQSGWEKLFQRAGLEVAMSEVHDLDFSFRDMVANEGPFSASKIALKCSFNSATRKRVGSIKKLFKEIGAYLGYGMYVCRKPAFDRGTP